MSPIEDLHGLDSTVRGRGGGARRAGATLDELYRSLAPEVRLWIRARASSGRIAEPDIDDIAQEVWLRVARSYARFDSRRGSSSAWICGITKHATLDFLRTMRSRTTSLDDPDVRARAAPAAAPAALRGESGPELPPGLAFALVKLSASDLDLLRICGVEGRPTSEAALELALSGTTVRKRWQRLRRRLAQRTDLAELVR